MSPFSAPGEVVAPAGPDAAAAAHSRGGRVALVADLAYLDDPMPRGGRVAPVGDLAYLDDPMPSSLLVDPSSWGAPRRWTLQ